MDEAVEPADRAMSSPRFGCRFVVILLLLLDWAAPAAAQGATDGAVNDGTGILSELRVGLSGHDVGLFGSRKESGIDLELDVLFASPRILEPILSPRPLIGASLNSAGDTNQLYGGLAWTWTFAEPLFAELGLNLSLHDGNLDDTLIDKGLGCRVLFRESLSLGVHFEERHSLMATVTHVSNAGLCDPNEGLDLIGLRYGFRF